MPKFFTIKNKQNNFKTSSSSTINKQGKKEKKKCGGGGGIKEVNTKFLEQTDAEKPQQNKHRKDEGGKSCLH